MLMVKAIVGANWGDEGKGKITDFFAKEADFTVRFQGGANAGHTIINNNGKFALHQLPSGVFYNNVTNIISNGCALNIESLLDELHRLESSDINCNLMISNRVQILLEHHILIDKLEEQRLADRAFGSTKSGIAPFYAEKYSKTGLQLWELYDINLKERLKQIYDKINNIIKSTYNADKIDYVKVYDKLSQLSQKILPYVKDTTKVLKEAIKQNKHILLEGQLGSLKDIDHGIYPYVTSSSTLAGYACTGAGISPIDISEILAVTKAYSSAVGEGPFVSEIFGNEADQLRARGGDAG